MLYITCYIITDCSVTSCQCSYQFAVLIQKADGCTVEFELAAEGECVTDSFCRSVSKCLHLGYIICVAERQHRISVRILLELLFQVASDPLRRGVWSHEFRILPFEGFKLLEKHVELIVTEHRGIIYIIPPVSLVEYASELVNPDICRVFVHKRSMPK